MVEDRNRDLHAKVSNFENVLRVRLSSQAPSSLVVHALKELYATKGAYDILLLVTTLFANEIEFAHKLPSNSGNLTNIQGTLPNPDIVQSVAPKLFDAVLSNDRSGTVKTLAEMGVLVLCPPQEQMFARLEFCAGHVIGRARLIVLVDMAIFAAELEAYERARKYLAETQALFPGASELHDIHTIEGIFALSAGNKAEAMRYLYESIRVCQEDDFARVTSSSRLPNLKLAKMLLLHSERTAVVAYLTQCKQVWLYLARQIDSWIATIQSGEKPEFLLRGILSGMDRPEARLQSQIIRASFLGDTLESPRSGVRSTNKGFKKMLAEHKRQIAAALGGKLETGKN
jgi:hypothetical protein